MLDQTLEKLEKTPQNTLTRLKVVKRDGSLVDFDSHKIANALTKAFLATTGDTVEAKELQAKVERYALMVATILKTRYTAVGAVNIEEIQDQVELILMREGEHKVARSYVLYREEHNRRRQAEQPENQSQIRVKLEDGQLVKLDSRALYSRLQKAATGLPSVDVEVIYKEVLRNIFDGIDQQQLLTALIMATRTFVEKDNAYSYFTARLLLDKITSEVASSIGLDGFFGHADLEDIYPQVFRASIETNVAKGLLNPQLLEIFDLPALEASLVASRDLQFNFMGLQILYDRYFLHSEEQRTETPQVFFMRVAMGLALQEDDPTARAIEFYNLLSSFDFMCSTPTLFNSGTLKSQLSSCYLTSVPDSLDGIYMSLKDNALLSKFAGGLGNDWTPVRALGSRIKGTNGKSQGVVPFLKVANDTAVAVNQGGKRKGAVCAYLETWHLDIEQFLELRKNTGDERRRTHDMNTANWIPDLFMKRLIHDQPWTLFSPDEVPDLHDLYGLDFETRYLEYEAMAAEGKITNYKQISATNLWRKMLSMLFETGHPWITFKDPCNLRSPQQHQGVVHSSNLCTEITLNTSSDEIAVCNLGSINLAQHVSESGINKRKLQATIKTAIRILDNVIDINYYSVEAAENSNLRHRPIGMGIMGFQDTLYNLSMPYASHECVEYSDVLMEHISYYAIEASSDLAQERGCYESFDGSLWSQGILPIDSVQILKENRGENYFELDEGKSHDLAWDALREKVTSQGMRNSNVLAIAPTATIANIIGVTSSIEPFFKNLYVRSNLSGEFTVINSHLLEALQKRGLLDEVMIHQLKFHEGSVQSIPDFPEDLKQLFKTSMEIDPQWIIESAARRQKWIDQAQSLNIYLNETDGKRLDLIYKMAWIRGLKTTYYLRSEGASVVEKSTVSDFSLNKVQNLEQTTTQAQSCSLDDPDCEACQ